MKLREVGDLRFIEGGPLGYQWRVIYMPTSDHLGVIDNHPKLSEALFEPGRDVLTLPQVKGILEFMEGLRT